MQLTALRTGPTELLAVWWVLPGVTQVKQARWSLLHIVSSTKIIKRLRFIWACAVVDPGGHSMKNYPKMSSLTS